VVADVPAGTGKIVGAEWSFDDSKKFTQLVDLNKATYSADRSWIEFDTKVSYDKPGTYFPTVKVYSERNGDTNTSYTRIPNLAKVRIVVN
jgi:hypothetical protein